MKQVVISGSGLFTPPHSISNEALVESFNAYVDMFNLENAGLIEQGHVAPLSYSSSEFIEKASGIKHRYVMVKDGILDPEIMMPLIPERSSDELSMQAEIGVEAALMALKQADVKAEQIDLVIVACAYTQRAYPAMAIEIQRALGTRGYGYDMQVACSSATFAIVAAANAIATGSASRVLVINPEICSAQVNYRDRDSHFIFGDVATAIVLEEQSLVAASKGFNIVSSRCFTDYSNNIRSNFGFLNRCDPSSAHQADKLFHQQGRKVFKELLPMIYQHLDEHLAEQSLTPQSFKRLWLHQANINMNLFVVKKLLGDEVTPDQAPVVLDEYANTASAGSVIAFHKYSADFNAGDLGLLSSFGAGYSIGSVILQKR
ncbi:beta-ketoacyl-ACP synthase III [Shewanella xiamenensis]|mgnify:FL=1|uniref:beta-ketoacyl-ACP synthase III n=1 Tax=Shewanella xiamenensis TaxID=332186 RepID=UPI0004D944DE|nr:beta-ketoacyl-ACP synthase III [Shewanella xiamenensis]KEK27932.1 3-oxoacyl-(acyl carrier protein) synthase III [Shewanella xiamenensis]MCD8548917.1 beta-ketoacyl-ACP synthase III [Shewanella xiamenensis]